MLSSTGGARRSLGCRDSGVLDWGRVAAGAGTLVLSFTLLFIGFIGVIH